MFKEKNKTITLNSILENLEKDMEKLSEKPENSEKNEEKKENNINENNPSKELKTTKKIIDNNKIKNIKIKTVPLFEKEEITEEKNKYQNEEDDNINFNYRGKKIKWLY
mgnify:CR=1 FL=1